MSTNPRPAKRQRRSTVVLSDDGEDDEFTPTALAVRGNSRHEKPSAASNGTANSKSSRKGTSKPSIASPASAKSSPKSSPEKSRKQKKLSIDETKSNKSLHTFFNRASDQDRWHKRSVTPEVKQEFEVDDDIIDDESADEALNEALRRSKQDVVKVEESASFGYPKVASTQSRGLPPSSQRFRKPSLPVKAEKSNGSKLSPEDAEVKPWAERYAPQSVDELAVHKKKIQDVQMWLGDALSGKARQRLLVIKGPAGSGKSATVRLLADASACELVAWQNPDTLETGGMSSSLQFTEFITRGGVYGALSLNVQDFNGLEPNSFAAGQIGPPGQSSSRGCNRILLVEEFPASMTSSSNALDSFRSVLLNAASATTTMPFGTRPGDMLSPPIILVVSETLVSSSTAFTDSFTTQKLLGPELLNHPAIGVIDFNPVAPTFLSKALDLVIKKEARESQRRRIPGPAILQKLAETGDIRNAVNSLQLLCTRKDDETGWSGTVAGIAKRGAKSAQPLSSFEENSLKLLSARETTLNMFHAAGKVCHNKRDDPRISNAKVDPPIKLSEHLRHFDRPKVSQVDIEALLNETGTDIQTFVSTVQQNYALSCNHINFVDYLEGCSAVLSDSELLDPDTNMSKRFRGRVQPLSSNFQLGTSDSLRQDEISFQVATRGVLFNLPSPVSRATPPGSSKGAAIKMYYPDSARLWRPIEETNGLIDLVIAEMNGQSVKTSAKRDHVKGVSTWSDRSSTFGSQFLQDTGDDNLASMPRLDSSKDNLITDILPYLHFIRSARHEDTNILTKITQMRGFKMPLEDEDESDAQTSVSHLAASRLSQKVEAAHRNLQVQNTSQSQKRAMSNNLGIAEEEPKLEKLYIEDDDIVDSD